MTVQRKGFDMAEHVLPRTVIERVYFVTPGDYTPSATGVEHETYRAALVEAIEREEQTVARLAGRGYVTTRVTVDTRWLMTAPPGSTPGSSQDTVAQRTTYSSLAEAREHLDRIDKYAHLG